MKNKSKNKSKNKKGDRKKLEKKSMTVSYNYGERQVVKHFHMHLLPDLDTPPTHKVEELYEKLK